MKALSDRSPHMRAFTLIELVIAIALLAVLMTFAYSALASIVSSKSGLDDGRDADMIANSLLTRLTRELGSAQVGGSGSSSSALLFPRCDPNNASPSFPGVALLGTRETLTNGEHGDNISFIASDVGQYLPDGGTHTGLVQISYRVEDDPDADPGSGLHLLIREEIPFLSGASGASTSLLKKACDRQIRFPITNRLRGLSFEYYDARNQRWLDSWGTSTSSGGPSLIRFSLQLESDRGVIRKYSTSVPVTR